MADNQQQLASDVLARFTSLMEDSGISLDNLGGWPGKVAAAPEADEVNEVYRAALRSPAGHALLVDLVVRFCIGGTYQSGGDPSAAVFDAGMAGVVREMIWRAYQEVQTDG